MRTTLTALVPLLGRWAARQFLRHVEKQHADQGSAAMGHDAGGGFLSVCSVAILYASTQACPALGK